MMRYSFFKNLALLFTGTFLFIVSCTQEACFEETNAYLKASLYLYSTQLIKAPDSLTLYGIGRDTSKIYNKSTSIRVVQIPLNSSSGNCGFVLKINGVNDTISFLYTSYPHLLSQECGYTYYHDLESFTTTMNIIDSVSFSLKSVTTLNGENIRIYY